MSSMSRPSKGVVRLPIMGTLHVRVLLVLVALPRGDRPADRWSGPTLTVKSVARRVQYFADGRPPVTTEEPAERSWGLPVDWFIPQD